MRPRAGVVVDLVSLAEEETVSGAIWAFGGDDLNVNLVRFSAGEGVDEHVNDEVEVLIVGIAGEGTVALDGRPQPLRVGEAVVIPKGARRAIRGTSPRFAYLTCHRRRPGLWPQRLQRAAPLDGQP